MVLSRIECTYKRRLNFGWICVERYRDRKLKVRQGSPVVVPHDPYPQERDDRFTLIPCVKGVFLKRSNPTAALCTLPSIAQATWKRKATPPFPRVPQAVKPGEDGRLSLVQFAHLKKNASGHPKIGSPKSSPRWFGGVSDASWIICFQVL